jgi:tetratricopeptide (TPR) repeat protein
MLTEAIAAARAGDRVRARELLTRLIRSDSANAEYWIWMSAVADNEREAIRCLESALRLDPTNRAARRGLTVLGARTPEKAELAAAARVPRRQVAAVATGASVGRRINWRIAGGGILGLAGLALITGLVISFTRDRGYILPPTPNFDTPTPTATSPEPSPTATPIPAGTRVFRTAIPTELVGTPLIYFVAATPTPTPLLGMTPHPEIEAYSAAIDALTRGDYEALETFMGQVIELDPSLPDAQYFLGEAHRFLGEAREALDYYDEAVLLDANYAAAYVGRGRLLAQTRPNDPLPADYTRAIQLDPRMVEAYLAISDFYMPRRMWTNTRDVLQTAVDAGITTPLILVRLSEAQFRLGDFEAALQSAMTGSVDDPTLLDGYLALGQAYVELEQPMNALPPLKTYVGYRPDDARGWTYLGRALGDLGNLPAALDALSQALRVDSDFAPAYMARGFVYLRLGDGAAGLSDMMNARRYGPSSVDLFLGIGRAYLILSEYRNALEYCTLALNTNPTQVQLAEAYALRALIYEGTTPPLLSDAILNWQWVLGIPDARPETRAEAQAHLEHLSAQIPTATPTPTVTPTETSTFLPGTLTVTPQASATPTPTLP